MGNRRATRQRKTEALFTLPNAANDASKVRDSSCFNQTNTLQLVEERLIAIGMDQHRATVSFAQHETCGTARPNFGDVAAVDSKAPGRDAHWSVPGQNVEAFRHCILECVRRDLRRAREPGLDP